MKNSIVVFFFVMLSTFIFAQSKIDYINYFNEEKGTDLYKLNKLKSTDTIFVIKKQKVCIRNVVVVLDSGEVRNIDIMVDYTFKELYTFEKPNRFYSNVEFSEVEEDQIVTENDIKYFITYTQSEDGDFLKLKNQVYNINGKLYIKKVYDIIDITDMNFIQEEVYKEFEEKLVISYVE